MKEELVKMSPKGQLVVPKSIRSKERFKPSDRFVVFGVKGGVLFKRVNIPNIEVEYDSLSRDIAKHFKKKKIKEKAVEEAVRWARRKR